MNLINLKKFDARDLDGTDFAVGGAAKVGEAFSLHDECFEEVEVAVTDLETGKSDIGHTHTESDITDLDKYTQAEADALLLGKSDTGHTHVEADITDLDKYTQAEANAKFELLLFVSTEQTGTGDPQSIAHGLGRVPTKVFVGVTDSGTGVYAIAEGTHTDTNVIITATLNVKYKVMAV